MNMENTIICLIQVITLYETYDNKSFTLRICYSISGTRAQKYKAESWSNFCLITKGWSLRMLICKNVNKIRIKKENVSSPQKCI